MGVGLWMIATALMVAACYQMGGSFKQDLLVGASAVFILLGSLAVNHACPKQTI